jgi:hypothetical protein
VLVAVLFEAPRMIVPEVALKVGKVLKVTETTTPQLPAPPPRSA